MTLTFDLPEWIFQIALLLINPFPNKPWFLRVQYKSFENTVGNFFFSHSVSYPFGKLSAIFIKFKIVICKVFQFGSV